MKTTIMKKMEKDNRDEEIITAVITGVFRRPDRKFLNHPLRDIENPDKIKRITSYFPYTFVARRRTKSSLRKFTI